MHWIFYAPLIVCTQVKWPLFCSATQTLASVSWAPCGDQLIRCPAASPRSDLRRVAAAVPPADAELRPSRCGRSSS